MALGVRADVRTLTGITDTNDLTDGQIDNAISYGESELVAATLKSDWETDLDNPLRDKAKVVVHYFASYHCLDRYSGNFEKANAHYGRAKDLVAMLKEQYNEYLLVTGDDSGNLGTGSSESRFSVVVGSYKSFPLNEDAEVYRSPSIIPGD